MKLLTQNDIETSTLHVSKYDLDAEFRQYRNFPRQFIKAVLEDAEEVDTEPTIDDYAAIIAAYRQMEIEDWNWQHIGGGNDA